MDRVIEKNTWNGKRLLAVGAVLLLLCALGFLYRVGTGNSRLRVDRERVRVSKARVGSFREYIPVVGAVMPFSTIYLDALEGGRVEEKFAEDGARLKKGQKILQLSNTDLELSLANQETQVFNVLTQMQIAKNNADQNSITRQHQLAEAENALKEAERVFVVNKKLMEQQAIPTQEYQSSLNQYEFQANRKRLALDIMKKDAASMAGQLKQMQDSYHQMQKTLALMRRKVEDLVVRSPIDGQLTSLEAEIGESKNKGQRLGQVDGMEGFKVRVPIDEHYISRIFPGQTGDFTLTGHTYSLVIKKVYTQVSGGRFQVDMVFPGKIPEGIRRGQTLQIRLALSDETQALLIPRGGFYQQTGGNWIFKVSADGKSAFKTELQIGRQSPEFYEIVGGLNAGDAVLTSSYETFGDHDELELY